MIEKQEAADRRMQAYLKKQNTMTTGMEAEVRFDRRVGEMGKTDRAALKEELK